MAVVESKLVITASDQTGATFKAIEERIERFAKVSAEIGRIGGSVGGLAGSANMAAEFERAERAVNAMAVSMEKAGTAIGEAVAKMDRFSSHVQRAERHVSALSKAWHGVKHVTKEVSPLVMGGAGFGMLEEVKRATEAGAELQHERVASANAGRTPAEIAAFEAKAQEVATRVPTATYTESMKTALETTSAFGSPEHALEHLEFMMRTAAVLKAASGGKLDESAGEMGQQFAKFFEMRGIANDPKRFEAEGNEMVRSMAATGGIFNPREMRLFGVQAKSALRNYDLDYLSRYVPSLVGETGGERAGTAANAFNNVILGKARDAKQAEAWMKYGLLDPKQVESKKGHVVSWSAGAVKGTDLAMSNPLKWFEQVALPAMKAKGVDVDSAKELTKALAVMFRNSMSNQWANENAQPADRQRLHKDADLRDKTETPEAMYKRNLADDPKEALTALANSINSFSAALTVPVMKNAAGVMDSMALSIAGWSKSLSEWSKANPTAAKAVGAGAIGGGLVAGGALGYGAFSALTSGFGLKGSAAALDGSAAALDAAAAHLGGKPGLGGGGGDSKGGGGIPSLFGRGLTAALQMFDLVRNSPGLGPDGKLHPPNAADVAAFDGWYKSAMPAWAQSGAGAKPWHEAFPPVSGFALSKFGSSSHYSHDFTLGSTGGFQSSGTMVGPSGTGFVSQYDLHRAGGSAPLAHGDLASMLSGKVEASVKPDQITAKLSGQADVRVTVTVEPTGQLIKAAASATSTPIRPATGTSMNEAMPNGRSGTGKN